MMSGSMVPRKTVWMALTRRPAPKENKGRNGYLNLPTIHTDLGLAIRPNYSSTAV